MRNLYRDRAINVWIVTKVYSTHAASIDFFDDLVRLREEKIAERALVAEKISQINEESEIISSIPSLASHLKETWGIDKKPGELAKVLKVDLGMRYRKIKGVSVNTNSERNLVLRQRFALELIRL